MLAGTSLRISGLPGSPAIPRKAANAPGGRRPSHFRASLDFLVFRPFSLGFGPFPNLEGTLNEPWLNLGIRLVGIFRQKDRGRKDRKVVLILSHFFFN